jgi:hypothetical protein
LSKRPAQPLPNLRHRSCDRSVSTLRRAVNWKAIGSRLLYTVSAPLKNGVPRPGCVMPSKGADRDVVQSARVAAYPYSSPGSACSLPFTPWYRMLMSDGT